MRRSRRESCLRGIELDMSLEADGSSVATGISSDSGSSIISELARLINALSVDLVES